MEPPAGVAAPPPPPPPQESAHAAALMPLRTLCNAAEPLAKRAAAATALKVLLSRPERRSLAQEMLPTLLQHLEPMLYEPAEQVARLVPPLLGAVGAAQQPDLRGFFSWIADAVQRSSAAQQMLPSGALRSQYLVEAFRELEEASEEGAPKSVFAEALGVPLEVLAEPLAL